MLTLAAPAKLPGSTFITVPLLRKNTSHQLPTLQQMNLFGSLEHCKARPSASSPPALGIKKKRSHPGAVITRRGDPILISSFLELPQESHVLLGPQLPCPGWTLLTHQALGPGSPPRMHTTSLHSQSRREALPSDVHHHLCPTTSKDSVTAKTIHLSPYH